MPNPAFEADALTTAPASQRNVRPTAFMSEDVMRTQAQVQQLFRRLYQELGRDPTELIQIKPVDGGWDDALSYEVTRQDNMRTRVWRRDLDDNNNTGIKACLSQFS